ncbi:hypothetical protein COW46_00775 [Candidatus Gracilibacteria bacterium CG17_big_fil_post_rev_8_21_14_2_50_48_13]|nr:MAG: hypothetical protein COW46_00775 [Candidatus Gracilibacteria bacterium CG17_big_fil_post_rev_8_21_14_2_50_48_13]
MYRFFFYLFLLGVVLCWLPASNAAILPVPSPHTVADKPVKFTAYQSYLAADGTVTLRRYIKAPTLHYQNPFVGKKIVSVKRLKDKFHTEADLAKINEMIPKLIRECGSIDAVFMVEAESRWDMYAKGPTSDHGLFQWFTGNKRYKDNIAFVRSQDFHSIEKQIEKGCRDFRAVADVNDVLFSARWRDWRSRDGMKWHGMANAYSPGVLKRFEIITE